MNARERYEKLGTQLLEELEVLPEAHPLKQVFSTSKLYQAILRDDVSYPEFEGPETIFGVSGRYLMRFDFLLEWTSTTLNQGPRAGRIAELSGRLSDLHWSMEKEFRDLDESELDEAVSSQQVRLEKAFQHEFDRAAFLRFSKLEIREAIDAVLREHRDSY